MRDASFFGMADNDSAGGMLGDEIECKGVVAGWACRNELTFVPESQWVLARMAANNKK